MATISTRQTRREILAKALKAAGAAIVFPSLTGGSPNDRAGGYAPKVSVQGYIWTQHFGALKETLAAGEDDALRSTHLAGYSCVELTSDFFNPPVRNRTRELLEKYHLKPESCYAGTTLHEAQAAETSIREVLDLADFLKPLGTKLIITNPSPKPNQERKSDDELRVQARSINQLGSALRSQGMRLVLHHHTPELRDNAREWWYELEHTDPALAGGCVDVHWAYRGGQAVMPFVQKVGSRLDELHLRNSRNGDWMEDFGPGDVDYAPIAAYLRQIRFRGYLVVELAYEKKTIITRSLEEDLRLSRIYTEKVFGLGSA